MTAIGYFGESQLVVASGITPLHPGSGRSPGAVDLPVQKDPFGIPFIPASSFKGAVKSSIALSLSNGECINGEYGEINCKPRNDGCNECCKICCLLGREPSDSIEDGTSAVGFIDLLPLFFPVPSVGHGLLYVTSPMLIGRALGIVDVVAHASSDSNGIGSLAEFLGELQDRYEDGKVIVGSRVNDAELDLMGDPEDRNSITKFDYPKIDDSIRKTIGELNPLYNRSPLDYFVVVSDGKISQLIDRILIRVSRIRVHRSKKSVVHGGLWTEEYIPQGTLFVGGVFYTKPRSRLCGYVNINNVKDVANEFKKLLVGGTGNRHVHLFIGGNETIGKGLLKLALF